MNLLFLLFAQLFMHSLADFHLQGNLGLMKQKSYWAKISLQNDKNYYNDWIPCLLFHAFEWSFLIHTPLLVFSFLTQDHAILLPIIVNILTQTLIHGIIDDLKCNRFKINLCEDQVLHLFQIFISDIFVFLMK